MKKSARLENQGLELSSYVIDPWNSMILSSCLDDTYLIG